MQFTTVAAIAISAAAAIATPLEARNGGWGSCSKDCQYTCTTNGILNILTCASVANGNTISIPLSAVIGKRSVEGVERRTGDDTCCTTNGIANVLTCVDLLDGNSVSVPITAVIGWL